MIVPDRRLGWTTSRLSQAGKRSVLVRILVQDIRDKAFTGVPIEVVNPDGIVRALTNGHGTVTIPFETLEPKFMVIADLPEGSVSKEVAVADAAHEVVTFRSVEAAPQPIVNAMEAVVGGAGIILFALGLTTKVQPLQVAGEIFFIASVFERVGRGL